MTVEGASDEEQRKREAVVAQDVREVGLSGRVCLTHVLLCMSGVRLLLWPGAKG